MIEVLGWGSAILVGVGYWLNVQKYRIWAMIIWILADIGWFTYDILIDNWSHAALCTGLLAINVYGIIKDKKEN